MIGRTRGLPRRGLLRGAGVALGLPWLESFARAAVSDTHPLRTIFMYVPNGFNMNEWTVHGTGVSYSVAGSLSPLRGREQDLLVLGGLTNAPAEANSISIGAHARGTAAFLTCVAPAIRGGLRAGTSVDQLIAAQNGRVTRLPSLQLGTEAPPREGACDRGAPCAYTSSISWAGPSTPLSNITDPQQAFDRLFGGLDLDVSAADRRKRMLYRTSIMDEVRGQVSALSKRVSATDRVRLDEYLTGLRELERRLRPTEVDARACATGTRPSGAPASRLQHVRLMIDLMIMAVQCDATRVASFMLANGLSAFHYAELNVSGSHHGMSHHVDSPAHLADLAKIDQWEISELAYLLDRLAQIHEGGASVLDSAIVYFSSEVEDGNSHRHSNLPVILAGRGGGALVPGKRIVFPDRTPLANLHLTLLGAAGVRATSFGDSTGTLPL